MPLAVRFGRSIPVGDLSHPGAGPDFTAKRIQHCGNVVGRGGHRGRGHTPTLPAGYSFRSRRSLATWPVAFTLYWATAILPFSSTTNVDRMTPCTVLPYIFFSP